jgi:hypothetical protein
LADAVPVALAVAPRAAPVGPLLLACGAAAGLAGLVSVAGGGPLPALAAYGLGGAGLMLAPVARAAVTRAAVARPPRRRGAIRPVPVSGVL